MSELVQKAKGIEDLADLRSLDLEALNHQLRQIIPFMNEKELATLRQKLERIYEIEPYVLRIAEKDFQWLRIQNTDRLFEDLLAKAPDDPDLEDERMPYWADLWPSALGLSQYLLREKTMQPEQTVLEIGCGLGLCGLVAASLGAQVTLSDYMLEPLEVARYLWLLNREEEPNLLQLDWRYPPPHLQFDVLLASDVSYETRAHEPLIEAIRKLLRPGGKLLLSEPRRATANAFFSALAQRGFLTEKKEEKVKTVGKIMTVDVYEIRL